MRLSPHDVVIFYTDGVVEPRSGGGDFESLRRTVKRMADLPPAQIVDGIFERIVSDALREDDVTLLAMKIL